MKKPVIGLTPAHDTDTGDLAMRSTYLKALSAADVIPVVLPLTLSPDGCEQMAETLDGFVFTGGPDPHPFLFGEETHRACGNVSSVRDTLELALLAAVLKTGKPVLGICRGIQIINVGLGGTIYQDILSQYSPNCGGPIAHRQPFAFHLPSHKVEVTAKSRLARICGCTALAVNSMHHQAVRDLAPSLSACAKAADGLIEGVEMGGHPWFLAVQWHPEHLWEQDEAAARLFQSFGDACRAGLS